jgi:hypothetical protein
LGPYFLCALAMHRDRSLFGCFWHAFKALASSWPRVGGFDFAFSSSSFFFVAATSS